MQISKILREKEKESFCKELNITNNPTKVLIKINDNKAEYYNPSDDTLYKIDIKVAKKYI